MSKIKSAYLKFVMISNSKYIKVKLNDDSTIFIRLKIDDFPHLVGIQYVKKYKGKKIPILQLNKKILDGSLLDDEELLKQPSPTISLIKRKLKVINEDFDFNTCQFYFPKKNKKIFLSDKVKGDMITINSNGKFSFAVLYIKGTQNIYHPISSLLFKNNDRKIGVIKTNIVKHSKVIKHTKKHN